jgi:UDP-N-acetylglucosamine 2-epimerase (non-hydrolysing)
MKILICFGTRPEAIKLAPVIFALRSTPCLSITVCITAQHRKMLDQVLELFDIIPDIDLDVMKIDQDLFDITASILLKMKNVISSESYDYVIVHGDTTTALVTALAAFYAKIPILHIEAGLRSHDIASPFPEELNRSLISKMAHWHFAPTLSNKINLVNEGIRECRITVTGNTVIDALHLALKNISSKPELESAVNEHLLKMLDYNWYDSKFILITAHRRENFGLGIVEICKAIAGLAKEFTGVHFIFPVHLNPNINKPVYSLLKDHKNIHLIPPLSYDCFIYLLNKCHLVITDSGGLQEEAPSLGKPVLVMRENTERPEAIEVGTVRLIGSNSVSIIQSVRGLLLNQNEYSEMSSLLNPYGDGKAALEIADVIKSFYSQKSVNI